MLGGTTVCSPDARSSTRTDPVDGSANLLEATGGSAETYQKCDDGRDRLPLLMAVAGKRSGAARIAPSQSKSTSTSPPDGVPSSTPTFIGRSGGKCASSVSGVSRKEGQSSRAGRFRRG